jgi:hypothetical protein
LEDGYEAPEYILQKGRRRRRRRRQSSLSTVYITPSTRMI